MRYSALYYPHTRLRTESLLKNALVVWDHVYCIVPKSSFQAAPHAGPLVQRAMELIVRNRIASDAEKRLVETRIRDAVRDGIPNWMRGKLADTARNHGGYLVHPEKLAEGTWRFMREMELARFDQPSGDYAVPPPVGLYTMALLADVCAGKTNQLVTDRDDAYAWLAGLITTEQGGSFVQELDGSQIGTHLDRLITISTRVLNTDSIPLGRIVEFREREEKGKSSDARQLRHRYLKKLDDITSQLLTAGVTNADREQIFEQFERDMRDDLRELRRELRAAATDLALSKEVGVLALAAAGTALAPAAFGAIIKSIGVGAFARTGVNFRRARRKALEQRAMSWLYLARPRLRDRMRVRA
jgi:hypothetical protein